MAVKAEKEEEDQSEANSVETKLEKVIEHHSEIGKVLEGIKEQLKKPPQECKPDTRGWDNIVEFFSEPVKGGVRAEKTLKFLGMLSNMSPSPPSPDQSDMKLRKKMAVEAEKEEEQAEK